MGETLHGLPSGETPRARRGGGCQGGVRSAEQQNTRLLRHLLLPGERAPDTRDPALAHAGVLARGHPVGDRSGVDRWEGLQGKSRAFTVNGTTAHLQRLHLTCGAVLLQSHQQEVLRET